MKRTYVFDEPTLTKVFQQSKTGERFHIKDKAERTRVYRCATCAGRQIATRKLKDGDFNATILE